MGPGVNRTERWSISSLLIWGFFFLLACNALAFIYAATAPQIRSDVYRHLEEIVLPLIQGQAGLSILWTNHHPSPLLHLIQLANLEFFDFRLDYEAYLGLFFQVVGTALILKTLLAESANETRRRGPGDVLFAFVFVAIALGFNSPVQYTWPLLATVQYLYFFGIVLFLLVDRCIRARSGARLLGVAVAALVFLFANADYAIIFLASIIALLVLIYCLERRTEYLHTVLVLASVWAVYSVSMWIILPKGPSSQIMSTGEIIMNLLEHPIYNVTRFAVSLSTGLVDTVSLKEKFPGTEYLLIGLALLQALIFVAIYITYLQKKLHRKSITPLALMMVAVLFFASVVIYRFWLLDNTVWSTASDRWAPTYKLAVLGMLWALWVICKESKLSRTSVSSRVLKVGAVLTACLILLIQGVQIYASWAKLPVLRRHTDMAAMAVYLAGKTTENDIVLPANITETMLQGEYADVISYLEKNRLNVFSENYPAGDLLKQHLNAHRAFDTRENALVVAVRQGEFGNGISRSGSLNVHWKILPTGILIDNTTGTTLYLRLRVSSSSYVRLGIELLSQPGRGDTRKFHVYQGYQNLFFSLGQGEKMEIKTAKDNMIEEFEVRI